MPKNFTHTRNRGRKMTLQNYETVASRVNKFYDEYPNGKILTELVENGGNYWIFKASVYAEITDINPIASGHAHEVIGASQINKTSALEVCETSAVGRALAFAGLHGAGIASVEEITRAKTRQAEPEQFTAIAKKDFPKTVAVINVKRYENLIAETKTITELMKAAETIANDAELQDPQKDVLREVWAKRRAAIQDGDTPL